MFRTRAILSISCALAVFAHALPAAGTGESAPATPDLDELLQAGQQLWEEYAPPEVKEEYEFPTLGSVETFLTGLQRALQGGSFEDLAAYEFDAASALRVLRQFEGGEELADWLEPRLDYLDAAGRMEQAMANPAPRSHGGHPSPPPIFSRPYWDRIAVTRKPPARAEALVPHLKQAFDAEGVPASLVWMAEVESSMNPQARSPAGARGLFQLMPATAKRFGLRVSWPDERTDPEKSAHAAAEYLRYLHGRFGSWPLALAAYNAGEGRVGRALDTAKTSTFAGASGHLPPETRLYVPKVLATVAARENIDPDALPAPRAQE